MDKLDERIAFLYQSGFVDEVGKHGLEELVHILTSECGISRTNNHVVMLITHVAMALKRATAGEQVNPIPESALQEVRESPVADEAIRVQTMLLNAMDNNLSEEEKDYILMHVGSLLMALQTDKRMEA